MLSSGCGSKPALRSAPEEKPRPAPWISTARTDSPADAAFTTSTSSLPNSAVHALIVSGLLSVIRPTGPSCCQMTVLMSLLISVCGLATYSHAPRSGRMAGSLGLPRQRRAPARLHRSLPRRRRCAEGGPDPDHARPLRPFLATGRGAAVDRRDGAHRTR